MIRLEVQEYCHACSDFEPDVESPKSITRVLKKSL